MTTIKVTVEDENADLLKKLLQEVSFVKNVEEETIVNKSHESESSYDRIKKILNEAKGKNLFADIKDPVEWQRELRKEWDRDF
ncbi:MAG: hypothetical protein JWR09_2100 [Mucilaginibacter sp.]|nr:hypothetical protein [Mucilaginibacter sp.]